MRLATLEGFEGKAADDLARAPLGSFLSSPFRLHMQQNYVFSQSYPSPSFEHGFLTTTKSRQRCKSFGILVTHEERRLKPCNGQDLLQEPASEKFDDLHQQDRSDAETIVRETENR